MSRECKIHVDNHFSDSAGIIFVTELNSEESFDSFKDEIFSRMPELKNQSLEMYYQSERPCLMYILRHLKTIQYMDDELFVV